MSRLITFFKTLLSQYSFRQKYAALTEELYNTRAQHAREVIELKSKIGDPRYVVEKVFGRKPTWFDSAEMTRDSQRKYFNDAQMILKSAPFNNIINKIIAEQCQEQIRQFNPHQPLNTARDVQMVINALELLKEELEAVPDPDKQSTTNLKEFNPYSGV